jgi:pectinesterase
MPRLADALLLARRASGPFRIAIEPGTYEEKLHIDRPDLSLVGTGADAILSFGASAGQPGPDGKPWGTGGSATLTVEAPRVTLANLTIANSFDFFTARPSGPFGGRQAVALSLAGGADRSTIRDCRILGYQDTLYVREGRALFEGCRISGGTDFIFGGAAALFRGCEIVSRFIPGAPIQGYVAAPSTPLRQEIGLVFDHCRLTREARVPDGSVFLGRPWRAGGNMDLTGFAAFIDCWMDGHVHPDGWTSMRFRSPDGPEGLLTPQQARLYERGSRGPGAGRPSPVRRTLPAGLAGIAKPGRIFGDWQPD